MDPGAQEAIDCRGALLAQHADVRLRRVTEADRAFLLHLYATTREQEMSSSGWPPEVVAPFLAQQFAFQNHHYLQHYPEAEFWLVERRDGTPVGRLTLNWDPHAVRIIDIALLPVHQGRGLGGEILRALIERAEYLGLAVDLHAQAGGRVLNLYRRLGFRQIADHGFHLALRRDRSEDRSRASRR